MGGLSEEGWGFILIGGVSSSRERIDVTRTPLPCRLGFTSRTEVAGVVLSRGRERYPLRGLGSGGLCHSSAVPALSSALVPPSWI